MNHSKSNRKKAATLGMSFSTACHQLRRSIIFKLLQQCDKDICYRCNKAIESADDVSIDHKVDWLNTSTAKELFFDLDNIAFSHKTCNNLASQDKRTKTRNVAKLKDKPRNKPYVARVWNGKKQIHLGYFATPEEAQAAVKDAKLAMAK